MNNKRHRDKYHIDINEFIVNILNNNNNDYYYLNDKYNISVLDNSKNNLRLLIEINGNHFDINTVKYNNNENENEMIMKLAISDYLFRTLSMAISKNRMKNEWIESYENYLDQFIIHRSFISINKSNNNNNSDCIINGIVYMNKLNYKEDINQLSLSILNVVDQWIEIGKLSSQNFQEFYHCLQDQYELRTLLKSSNAIAFVANGSILPRCGGNDKRLDSDKVVPFMSPVSLEKEFILQYKGKITGMLIPKGVTVITGGGYNGKSTLLNALKMGIYDKVSGDGREFVIIDRDATSLRSEDGRYINSIDVSSFISNLPAASALDTTNLCTNNASGSTSMASIAIENIEFGTTVMLLDEDTCASNFMIRDSRMRSLIKNEPIIPYIYRVNGLYKCLDISSIVVVGGSGDWFDVQDTTIMMDNYECLDVTKRVVSISKTFCTGRVQYNGQGLVHQLSWNNDIYQRHINIHSFYDGLTKLCDEPSNLLLTSSLSGNSLHINNDHLFIDLSKIEQKIPGSMSTRGIGLAILFIVFKYSKVTSISLFKLVKEFDDIRYHWNNTNTIDNTCESTCNEDLNRLKQIHSRNLNGKAFLFPRNYEIISAINRCRLATFHNPT